MVKKRVIVLISAIVIVVLTFIGSSYALFQKSEQQEGENVITTTSCLDISISNGKNAFNLNNAYPISDEEGLEQIPYTFSVTNNCETYLKLDIGFELSSTSTLPASVIKAVLTRKDLIDTPALLNTYPAGTALNGGTAYILLNDGLRQGETKYYDYRMWVDYSATYDDVKTKGLSGNIIATATVATDKTILGNILKNATTATTLTTPGVDIATTDEGIRTAPDDYGTSYYFRGAVENNYLVFANMCWRIVRIDGAENTKLVLYNYNPNSVNNPCASSEDGRLMAFARLDVEGSETYSSKFNTTYNKNTYVGFMYSNNPNSTDFNTAHANDNDSAILTFLKTWYDEKLRSYNDLLADTIWCNDKSIVRDTSFDPWNAGNVLGTGLGTDRTYYQTTRRLYPTNEAGPSLICPSAGSDGKLSKFTARDSVYGNAKLTSDGKEYKIGLLTADEVAYAGGVAEGATNKPYYLYKNANEGGGWYWLLSPNIAPSTAVWRVYGHDSLTRYNVDGNGAVRPAVSLKSTVTIAYGGEGTQSNPYVVS